MQRLHNHVRPIIVSGQAARVAPLPEDQSMHLSIVLPLRNESALNGLLRRLYDPASPDYHHFLSVENFTEQFGPTPEDYQAVVAYAMANGFKVTEDSPNRLVVPITGSVAQINKALNLTMQVYRHPTENRTFYSPDREPSLSLAVPVAHIAGLNDFSIPHPAVRFRVEGQAIPNVTGSGPGGSYLGSDMRAAYYGGTALTGAGQVVGILEFGGYNLSDVNLSFSSAGQSYSVPISNVLLNGASAGPVGNDDAEQVLDIVQAIGMAPGLSQVRVYIAPQTGSSQDVTLLNAMASENLAKQLSCSWGWTPEDPSTDDVFFKEFAAQGQSFFVASGDDGAFDAAISPYFYPAEDANVTAVGATHLTTNSAGGAWVSETAWNNSGYGSGGGISPDGIPIASWQSGLSNSANGGSATLRNVPDVAMEGDFDNYYCSVGSCGGGEAGTSFAAPRWAGFMALVNQQAVEAGTAPAGGVGFINPALYAIAASVNYGSDLHDITVGNNDTDAQPVWFNAVPGYDLVTGLGSANGQSLINVLAGPQVPGFWLQSSSASLSVNQAASASATITVTDAGGFAGPVTLAVTSGLPSGVTASWGTNPTTGSSVLKFTASSSAVSATSTVTITGTSGTLTATTQLTLTVHGASFTLSTSPSSLSINQGASGTSTVTVTPQNGFTGNVSLSVSGLPSGVTASWSKNPTTATSVLTLTASSTAASGTATVTIAGTYGTSSATTTLSLTVYAPSFTLSSSSVSIAQGKSGSTSVSVSPVNGFTGSVSLAASGLPSGVTASFTPNPITASSVLTLTASSTATVGTTLVLVTGTSGILTASTSVSLTVRAAPAATSTTLTVTSAGSPVASVPLGTVVTLTAAVSAGSTSLTKGQVKFCDATAALCEDIHLLGTAQLTSSGTAILKFVPAMGSHSYKAIFAATQAGLTSSSTTAGLNVTAANTSATTLSQSGAVGNYTLTATVTAPGSLSPSGTVSFLDTSNAGSLLGSASLQPVGSALAWTNSQSPATGSNPHGIATADFNGDGISDLAVPNYYGSTVTILLGKGDGTFLAATASPSVGNLALAVLAADFNGDGKQDLAVTNQYDNTVTILLGRGDGAFNQGATLATGSSPLSIVTADFNGDGIPDLATANSGSNAVTILLGNGDGTFTPIASPATGVSPASVAVGDFNRDGIPDLAVANENSGTITILLGRGDGTFTTAAVSPQAGSEPDSIAIADFNGDGIDDLVVANDSSATLSILLGNGDGTFALPTSTPAGTGPTYIATGDFNGDGKVDLAVSNYSQNFVTILLGNGTGTFTSSGTIPTGSDPYGIAVADFNANGIPDLAVADSASNTVTILTSQLTQTATATATGISPVGSGIHLVDASYSGDSNYASSVSATTGLTAQPASGLATASITVNGSEQAGDASAITVSFNGFSETVRYDTTSTANSVASAFAAMFSRDYLKSGLCASATGNSISFKLKQGAFQHPTITDSNLSFNLVTAGFP